MSYRNYIKGLKRRKLTLGMYNGKFEEIKPLSQLQTCKYELMCEKNNVKIVYVNSVRNREDMLIELVNLAYASFRTYKRGSLYFYRFFIFAKVKGGKKELLIDSWHHHDFIMYLTDRKPKEYA